MILACILSSIISGGGGGGGVQVKIEPFKVMSSVRLFLIIHKYMWASLTLTFLNHELC